MIEETRPGFLANYKIVRPGLVRLGPARAGPTRNLKNRPAFGPARLTPLIYITRSVVLLITVHLSLNSTCMHRRSVEGHGLARSPQKFYRIHNDLESLFEKNKQIKKFQKHLFKIFSNFLKIFKNL